MIPMHGTFLKSIRTGFISVLFVIAFTNCEALDFADPNSPSIESATIQTLVTGAEAGMRVDLDIFLAQISVVGREAYYFEGADPRYTGELIHGPIDPGGFLLNRPWAARYNVIMNCNLILDKATEQLSGEDLAGVNGFSKTILAYQLLLNLYLLNDNGVKLDFTGDLTVEFATKAASFAAIETYLDDGNTDLGNAGSEFSFVLSGGFAGFDTPTTFAQFNRALKARVEIQQNSWAAALTALDESFLDVAGGLDLGVFNVYSTSVNDLDNGLYETPTAAFVKWMGHPTFMADADTLAVRTANDSLDSRLTSKITVRGASLTMDNLSSNLGVIWLASSTTPTPIIRNEELILLRAEANIGLGNYSLATADINIIRAAAGVPAIATLDISNALDQLLHEKRYSLFLEGHRWGDMRRYGKLDELPLDRVGDTVIESYPKPETEVEG